MSANNSRPASETSKQTTESSPRRARAAFGTTDVTEGWPLAYLPRWSRDHHPWALPNWPDGIRFSNGEVYEKPADGAR
jgi:hypothetical protein